MFVETNIFVDSKLINTAIEMLPDVDFRLSFNEPSGQFFYDPWIIKKEYKGTIWDQLLSIIPGEIGEARLIKLEPGCCYRSHSDMDDRWHLSIISDNSFIVDIDNKTMYQQSVDYQWHFFNAGVRHSAVNFGSTSRYQLVVRSLLQRGENISDPKTVSITLKTIINDRRYIFDDIVSPWLNEFSKKKLIDNFQYKDLEARFIVDSSIIPSLRLLIEKYFNLEIIE